MGNFVKDHKIYTSDGVVTINDADPVLTRVFVGLLIIIVLSIIIAVVLGGI